MKKLFVAIAASILAICTFAQVPQKMSYQAVIRDAANTLVMNHAVGMRISILQGSPNGVVVYTETRTLSSNSNGLVSLEIGGQSGFDAIDWSDGPYFIKTETDPAGGTNYGAIIGTSQILSVPYALHSKTTESYTESDPVFAAHPANAISSSLINSWNNAYTWGNHANAGYLTTFTEVDPGLNSNFDFTGASANDLLKFNGTKWAKFTPDFASSVHSHEIANALSDGFLSGADWTAFNSKENSLTFNGPLNRSGNTVSMHIANNTSDGYLSSSDWTNFNNKGSFNLPSLTSGSLLFSNGTTIAQDNSNLFWDNTNKRLGIGTATPAYKLEITGNTRITDQLVVKSINFTPSTFSYFATINGNSFLYNNNGHVEMMGIYKIYTNGGFPLTFHNQSQVIFSSGNVGIGTTNPTSKLEVNGVVKTTGGNSDNWNTAYGWGNHSGLYKPVSYVPLWTEIISKPDFAAVATTGNFDDLLLKPTTLEGYGITNGISTSHAVNSITASMINNWNSSFSWGDHSVEGYYKNGGENGGTNRLLGNMDNYSLSLITNNSSRIYIGNTGNIGIGTEAPTQKLDVAGVAQISSQVYSPFFNALPGTTNGNNVTIQAGKANGGFGSDLQMSGGSMNGGNVKIEGGSANHFGQGGNVELIAGDAFDTNSKGGSILLKAKGYSHATLGYIAFFTGGSYPMDLNNPIERMRLAGNGNLGIGTTTPAAKVDISGNIKITDGSQGAGKVLTSDANGLATWQALSSGGFTGNGTTNYWTKWTSGSAIANAMASDDGTSISIQALTNRDNPGTVTIRGGKGQSGTGHVYIYGGNYYYSGGDWQGGGNRTSGNVYIYAGAPEYGTAAGGSVIIQASAGSDSRYVNGTIQLLNGNVGIGTTTPNASAIVDMSSTTRGFLPPRMTKSQRDAIIPVAGLMIYNLSTNKPNFYDGTSWKTFDGTPID